MFCVLMPVFQIQAVLGVSYPLETYDRVNYRTLNLGYNFQAQYMLVKPAQLPWWLRVGRSLQNQKENYLHNKTSVMDKTREIVYNAVEILMVRYKMRSNYVDLVFLHFLFFSKGINGRECLQRAICEHIQSPIRITGIFHEILSLFLT